jgi:23S rRNA pseudouridine1911/1915/1917 synthase
MRQSSSRPKGKIAKPGNKNIAKFQSPEAGPLLQVACAILHDHSATKVKSMLRHRQLAVNGTATTQFDYPVHAGDELWVNYGGSFDVFKHPHMKLVYEDESILVVDKGYGMLSTAAGKVKDATVFSVMRDYVKKRNEHARVFIVHRLDRDTSGLMLLTRTAKAREKLVKNWTKMVLERHYEAVVEGIMEEDEGTIKSYLYDGDDNYTVHSTDNPEMGELAKTQFTVLERGASNTLVQLSLRKGLKNQLRVHMSTKGHPISGDRKYGGHPNAIKRLALHATRLTIMHPTTGEEMAFHSAVPESFKELLK